VLSLVVLSLVVLSATAAPYLVIEDVTVSSLTCADEMANRTGGGLVPPPKET
jgi:hypothetical protein